jgi:hypothetical protein
MSHRKNNFSIIKTSARYLSYMLKAVCSEILVMALSNCHIIRLNLKTPEELEGIALIEPLFNTVQTSKFLEGQKILFTSYLWIRGILDISK